MSHLYVRNAHGDIESIRLDQTHSISAQKGDKLFFSNDYDSFYFKMVNDEQDLQIIFKTVKNIESFLVKNIINLINVNYEDGQDSITGLVIANTKEGFDDINDRLYDLNLDDKSIFKELQEKFSIGKNPDGLLIDNLNDLRNHIESSTPIQLITTQASSTHIEKINIRNEMTQKIELRKEIIEETSLEYAKKYSYVQSSTNIPPIDPPTSIHINTGSDGILSTNELNGNITVDITFPITSKPGNIVEIDTNGDGIADTTYTITSGEPGTTISVLVPGSSLIHNSNGDIDIDVSIKDDRGSTSSTKKASASSYVNTIDDVEIDNGSNNILNILDLTGNISIDIDLSSSVLVGSILQIDTNGDGAPDTTHTIASGEPGTTISVSVPGSSFTPDGSGNITASVSIKDLDNNISTSVDGISSTDTIADNINLSLNTDTGVNTSDNNTSDTQINVNNLEGTSTWKYSTDGGSTWNTGSGTSFDLDVDTTYNANDIKVKVTDIADNESTASISTSVTTYTNAIDVNDDSFSTNKDTAITITFAQLLINDSDLDNNTLSISKIENIEISTLSVNQEISTTNGKIKVDTVNETITFTPNTGYEGSDAFSYTTNNSKGLEDTASVDMTVISLMALFRAATMNKYVSASGSGGNDTGGEGILDLHMSVYDAPDGAVLKLYRYEASTGQTILMDTTTVGSNGLASVVADAYEDSNGYLDLYDGDRVYGTLTFNGQTLNLEHGIETYYDSSDGGTRHRTTTLSNTSPIILDLDGDGVETLSVYDNIKFDIDADGDKDQTGWVGADDGLLVRDLNNDGIINDASELFGEETVKEDGITANDGYEALAELDSNSDRVINSDDETYDELKIWKDSNSDGITDEGELLSLAAAGIEEISLDTQESNAVDNGNTIGIEGTYTNTDGETLDAADVWFAYEENNQEQTIDLNSENININVEVTSTINTTINIELSDSSELFTINEEALIENTEEQSTLSSETQTTLKEEDNSSTYNIDPESSIKLIIDDKIDIGDI